MYSLVVTASRRKRAWPKQVWQSYRARMVRVQKFAARSFVDAAFLMLPIFPIGDPRSGDTGHISFGSDAEHSEPCAARVGFTDPGVQLFQRIAGIRKSVLPVL